MNVLTPREIVSELDKYIIGQNGAKRMVAVAMRNRWRRQQIDPSLRDEIAPKNIIMMGPTGVGKTEIARRLAKLSASPFVKVEATKFTEVGYVGRDVESMVRDLMELSVALVRDEEATRVRAQAETNAEERLLDLLLPGSAPKPMQEPVTTFDTPVAEADKASSTREKMRKMFRDGKLDDREVEMELEIAPQGIEVMAMPGMEDMGGQFKDLFSKAFPSKKKKKRMRIGDALPILVEEEAARLIDEEKVTELAKERVEQSGIIFIDEIDKVASSQHGGKAADISREGVQRDLLPIVEGSVVNTKYGMIKTDHILFIAAGAFHHSKPADLIPELQGRFPLRAELTALGKDEFLRILKEPRNALTVQYMALLATEGVTITFAEDGLDEIAAFAEMTNQETENIGARRLYTIMEKILSDISFEAPDRSGEEIVIDRAFVEQHLEDVREDRDLSRYIL
ncbi:ATP-dependent protease ATPase subunit HslU [Halodesulfovibrio aestuarii]|uniref:ATP-dependent protease ATPase subunit HslU n=1 Tax=Halodesulfovibrio aestuarii TaxID=126333 RepID=UPI003D33CDBF